MPDSKASMRSIAKWVLPVLVGPRTAVLRLSKSPRPGTPTRGTKRSMPRASGFRRRIATKDVRRRLGFKCRRATFKPLRQSRRVSIDERDRGAEDGAGLGLLDDDR